jgi:hypothetical protein
LDVEAENTEADDRMKLFDASRDKKELAARKVG